MTRCNPNLYLLIFLSLILFPCISFAQLQINSITSTPSTCSNNGSITVNASATSLPILYSITGGPLTQPIQTANVFNSLPPGTYTVRVTDVASNSTTGSVTIGGNYLQPDMNPIKSSPYCIGSSTGQIIGNKIAGTGNGPYTWQLLSPSPVTTAPQVSDTFNNLPAGNYTLRLSDACGGFRTIVVTLSDAPSTNLSFQTQPQVNMIGCDSAMITMYMRTNLFRFPLTLTVVTNTGTFTTTTPTRLDTLNCCNYFTVEQIIPHFTYGNFLEITITDNCGTAISTPRYYAKSFVFCPVLTSHFADCIYKSTIGYDLNNFGCNRQDAVMTNMKPPLIYSVTDVLTNTIVDADTLPGYRANSGYFQVSGFNTKALITDKTYNVAIKDGCGRTFSQQMYVPALVTPPAPRVAYKQVYRDGCLDSTAYISISVDYFRKKPQLVLLSGPTRMGSTKPGYEYESAYSYPDTLEITGVGVNTYVFSINNLTVGTYQFKVIDSCGSEVFDSFRILPAQVTDFHHRFSYKKGCLGRNELHYTITAADGYMRIRNLSTNIETFKYYNSQDFDIPIHDSITNLASGTYEVTFVYDPYFSSGKPANSIVVPCQQIKDTVVIEGYQTATITAHNYVSCKQTTILEIVADSSKGVPPFEYEIVSGPAVFPMQTSSLFAVNTPGTYTVRIYDVCGNASTSQITVTQIVVPPVTVLPLSCNSQQLTFGSSSLYTYRWTAPNGTVFTGDTLNINPITPADTGIYTIRRITDINGCRDSSFSTFHLVSVNVYERIERICPGSSITIGTHTYNSTGEYTDTLKNVKGCDSIVFLRLTVLPLKRDTVYQSICPGMQFQFNGKSYSTAGIYSDTLATSTCDSIATLVLSTALKQQSFSLSICENTQYNFNGRILTSPGIYRDTLSTTSCDSIVILDLSVLPSTRSTINHTICVGDQFNFNGKIITTNSTGEYTDTLKNVNGCDSIVFLRLTVLPLKRDTVYQSICSGMQFQFNGKTYSTAGTYSDTLATSTCDSIATLVLSTALKQQSFSLSICENTQYNFNGRILTSPGIYRDTLPTASCDSIVILDLSVLPSTRSTFNHTICAGDQFNFNGKIITTNSTGEYTDTLKNVNGCDSIVLLRLTVLPLKRDTVYHSICPGMQFQFNGKSYSTAGTYSDTLATSTCDSIATLVLSVALKQQSFSLSICENTQYNFNGRILTSPGIYRDTLPTASCDSIVILNLSVLPSKRSTFNHTICVGDQFNFNGKIITTAGRYTDTLSTASCDSIVTVTISVVSPTVRITASQQTIVAGDRVQLRATDALSYLWSGAGVIFNNVAIYNPGATLPTSAWIYLQATSNPDGCMMEDSLFINVIDRTQYCVDTYIHMPSAFSPNGDGVNDVFRIVGKKISLKAFMVFNRWGEQVFVTNELNTGWNGEHKGKKMQGSYVYYVSYTDCMGETKLIKGTITIIR